MKPSAHRLRGPPASGTLHARLLHTLFVFTSTSLMFIIAILSFLLTLLLKSIMPAPSPSAHRRRGNERHVTFLEPSIVITPPTPAHTPAPTATATLSLTATPHELEPPTPDVAEDAFHALSRLCGFLAANSARAWKREELAATPPLAGLEPYLAAVREDLTRIEEMGEEEEEGEEGDGHGNAEGGKNAEETEGAAVAVVAVAGEVLVGDLQDAGTGTSAREDTEAGAGEAADAGAGAGASADAHDEPGLVPAQAARATPPPLPPSQLPTQPTTPDTSATPAPTPTPPTPPEPTARNTASPEETSTIPIPSTSMSMTRRPPPPPPPTMTSTARRPPPPLPPTTTRTPSPGPGPRTRKDAVLRPTRPTTILGPGGLLLSSAADPNNSNNNDPLRNAADADKLADSDDAAVRAAALFSRVADVGAGLFEGTVRERGAALWAALSGGRSAPSDVPVPSMPRTRFATGAAERG